MTIRPLIVRTLVATLAGLMLTVAPGAMAAKAKAEAGFAVRMVKLAGKPGDPATVEHVRFCRKLGFNALWVYSHEAGTWTKDESPHGPTLDPSFLRLAQWCRRHRMDLWVSINPPADTSDRFVFSDPDDERRLLAFVSLLREQAGVRTIVLSFDDQPTELRELSDVFRYGVSTAPAHLDFLRRVAAALPPDIALWMCASAYCDAHLGDGQGRYSKPFLAGLPSLPSRIGIVWTGPKVLSPAITTEDLEATRARLGGRPLLLYDNLPVNEFDVHNAIGLVLSALRGRDPGIARVVAAYLACPFPPLAGARLTLLTTAEYLRDPEGYDADAATKRAIATLAGRNRAAQTALDTQQLEWGGTIDGRNYWPRDLLTAEIAARRLHDPAFVESFTWTVARYPGRIAAMTPLADAPFRDELQRMMRRRLAVGQAVPLTIEYLARVRAGRIDAEESLARIAALRQSWSGDRDATRILDNFFGVTGLPVGGHTR